MDLVNSPHYTSHELTLAIETLKNGGVVALPTDTVYCLAAALDHPKAISRIFDIKGRQTIIALPVLVSDADQLRQVAETPPLAELLMQRFMPGGLTMILKRKGIVPDIVTGGRDTVAVRIPNHALTLHIIRATGMPLTGTSANLSGHGSVDNARDVLTQLGSKVDMILNGGRCPGGRESTIVDLTTPFPTIVRDGAVPRADLEAYYI
ncbi:TsaC [Dehalogenimonas sp. WBC-2]|nr:TsaC [Dehalogenimonas sp. WBC-2]